MFTRGFHEDKSIPTKTANMREFSMFTDLSRRDNVIRPNLELRLHRYVRDSTALRLTPKFQWTYLLRSAPGAFLSDNGAKTSVSTVFDELASEMTALPSLSQRDSPGRIMLYLFIISRNWRGAISI